MKCLFESHMRALIEFLFSILNILLRMWPVFREKDPIVERAREHESARAREHERVRERKSARERASERESERASERASESERERASERERERERREREIMILAKRDPIVSFYKILFLDKIRSQKRMYLE